MAIEDMKKKRAAGTPAAPAPVAAPTSAVKSAPAVQSGSKAQQTKPAAGERQHRPLADLVHNGANDNDGCF